MTTPDSPPLDTVGSYDLLEKVGVGSMGTVYRARHFQTKEIVAIKVMHAEVARNPILLKRFEQEFRITSRLDHPNIVRVIEFSGLGTNPYLVMEFIDGESLMDRLERDGKLPEDEAVRLIVQVAHGLHRAHKQGLVHRDVKPDNIMVTRDGQAKLLDLGLAKDADAGGPELTRAGQGLGTPDFMAPEQFRNAKNASVRCDIYSLGATLYMMVTGQYPFDEDDPLKAMMRKLKNELAAPRQLVPSLAERTDWAIRRALSADPEMRPSTCREFVEDLIGQSTRKLATIPGAVDDVWYVTYRDSQGETHTVKGSTQAIRRSVKSGLLNDGSQVRACRTKTGAFEPLRTFPEFRDLVVVPVALPPTEVLRLP